MSRRWRPRSPARRWPLQTDRQSRSRGTTARTSLGTRARLQLVDALGADNRKLGHAVGKAILAQLLQVRAVFIVEAQHHRTGSAKQKPQLLAQCHIARNHGR